ncbi:hypothetical protein PG996_003468 [Apiospora saccharicola]|uniref:Uncharacterized protein n=1 Tax=Apiospora saccharicola TaxID=335842 RepID=A0ABR1W571_9PEZI
MASTIVTAVPRDKITTRYRPAIPSMFCRFPTYFAAAYTLLYILDESSHGPSGFGSQHSRVYPGLLGSLRKSSDPTEEIGLVVITPALENVKMHWKDGKKKLQKGQQAHPWRGRRWSRPPLHCRAATRQDRLQKLSQQRDQHLDCRSRPASPARNKRDDVDVVNIAYPFLVEMDENSRNMTDLDMKPFSVHVAHAVRPRFCPCVPSAAPPSTDHPDVW